MNVPGVPFLSSGKDEAKNSGAPPILQLRAFLRRQWPLIAAITVFSILLGTTYVIVAPNKYTAQTNMILDTKKIVWVQSEMTSENRGVDDGAVESEIETTKSEKVAGAVIRRLHLTEDPEFVGSRDKGASRWTLFGWAPFGWTLFGWAPFGDAAEADVKPSEDDLMRNALAKLSANLRVIRVGRSYHEQISYTSLDRVKAAKIANAFAQAYIDDQLDAKFEATQRASDWLQQRLAELRQQASDAYKAVQDFKSSENIIISPDGRLANDVELDQLGIALAKARADTSQAKAKLDRIMGILDQRSEKEDFNIPDPVVTDALNSPVITRLRQQFLEDQNRMMEWSIKYGPNHNAVLNLRTEMRTIQNSIWDEISRIAESYKSEYQITRSQEDAIDRRITELFQKSFATRQSQVKLRELETAATSYRNIYETFLSRFTQSVQQQSFPSTEARVVTVASPPRSPSSPKIALTLALAALCGLMLGITCAVAREQLTQKIQTRGQLETLLGTSCLAVLPDFSRSRTLIGKLRARDSAEAFHEINKVSPFSATAEALRHIKVAIDLGCTKEKTKVVGMVSALAGEGKTTVAAAFAAFVAKNGARTLLVDADLRNPLMTKLLGHAAAPGLLDLVTGGETFDRLVIADANYKFDFLPASTKLEFSDSSDVLKSAAVKDMLKKVKGDYDYVLVDLPPILPVVDVKAAADLFDCFILVVEWASTSVNEIVKATGTSPTLSSRLLGTILNKADKSVMRRFEGYSDDYAYYAKGERLTES
jgi:exopolysaccharide transport family protein